MIRGDDHGMWFGKGGAKLPGAGDAFLVPLGEGRFSFCWVVGFAEKQQSIERGVAQEIDVITLASAKWVGTEPPTAADLARPELLVKTYWKSQGHPQLDGPLVTMESRPVPKKFRPLGKVGRAAGLRGHGFAEPLRDW